MFTLTGCHRCAPSSATPEYRWFRVRTPPAEGYEMTFGVNHLGHFALVCGLLDTLTTPSRIVVVSSGTHNPAKFTGMPHPRYTSAADLARPTGEPTAEEGRRRYTTSKLCNLLFTYELDRRLEHGAQGVTVNAFDPGMMPGSGLGRDYPPLQRFAWRYVMPALRFLPGVNSTRTSGRHLAALAPPCSNAPPRTPRHRRREQPRPPRWRGSPATRANTNGPNHPG
jgi:NAD(P)-dependent dehydrogenase (short-subunit alcohol dehydrogenase family)